MAIVTSKRTSCHFFKVFTFYAHKVRPEFSVSLLTNEPKEKVNELVEYILFTFQEKIPYGNFFRQVLQKSRSM